MSGSGPVISKQTKKTAVASVPSIRQTRFLAEIQIFFGIVYMDLF